jgi:UDP-2,3-diacylglucosamine hydrolase
VAGAEFFVSDLHLSPERPAIRQAFFAFLLNEARAARALYILGDLFDAWIGDDDLGEPLHAQVATALRALSASGCTVFFMAGNRDFLLGPDFARAAGLTILPDASVIVSAGTRTLLMHGDALCTADIDYQAFRAKVHTPAWQRAFLAKPITERRAIARQLLSDSSSSKQLKTDAIMDVSPSAVEEAFLRSGCTRLIHGHTHRPGRHEYSVEGVRRERWVLADWYQHGSYLGIDADGRVGAVTLGPA